MDDAVPAAAVTSLLFAFLTVLGNGSPWQGVKRVFEDLWSGIKRIFGVAPAIPRPDYDRIEELERWNREWTHPDLKGFTHVKEGQFSKEPREGFSRIILPNGEEVNFRGTIGESFEKTFQENRKRCKSSACGGFREVYRSGYCKGCYEVGLLEVERERRRDRR